MSTQHTLSEYETRTQKLHMMRTMGIVPYAEKFDRTHTIKQIIDQNYKTDELRVIETILEHPHREVSVAGRVMLYRTHGKISFARIQDQSGVIQVMLNKDATQIENKGTLSQQIGDENPLSAFAFFEKFVDVGDFVGVTGEVFYTHKGELTIFVSSFTFLSKALRPLGDKWHGVTDQETLYRQRYLDTIINQHSRDRFLLRSKFLKVIRDFYHMDGFVEVETPVLGFAASGAAAAPFVTHHNEMDVDMFLRISPETALKKMTVGMFEKVFEVAKDFRNEGSDPSHHQEFTMIEHYAVYRDYKKNMDFTEDMFRYIFSQIPELKQKILVTDKQGVQKEVDFSKTRERIDYVERIKADSGIDVTQYTPEDADRLRNDIIEKGHHREGIHQQATATLIDYLYKKVTRPKIVDPAFIYNYPKTMQPLARVSDANPLIVEQRQLVINGREVIKAYSELVDPIMQQQNFDEQAAAVEQGDDEATKGDEEFVLAMEYGMPPQSGRGMGVDRILALLTEQDNIRDVIYFPLMKPLHKDTPAHQQPDVPENYPELPSLEQVYALLDKYVTDTRPHLEEVGKVMAHFARKLGKNERAWHLAGLLHDLDRDCINKNPEIHCAEQFVQMAEEIGLPTMLIADIQSHYQEKHPHPINSLLRKYLISVDELTGFL